MRRLRIITTLFVLLGVAILFSYPWSVGTKPDQDAPAQEKRAYAMRLMIVFAGTSFALLGAATGAMLLARRIRQEYADRSLKNLANLLTAATHESDKENGNGG